MNATIEQSWILDYWPIISDAGKVIGVIIAALWTLTKYREQKDKDREQQQKELQQRQDEMRRDQCSRGLAMMNELLKSNDGDREYYSWDAMRMLDYKNQRQIVKDPGLDSAEKVVCGFKSKFSNNLRIDDSVISDALNVKTANSLKKQYEETLLLHVRESFDELYFRMGQLEDSINAGLVKFNDVKTPIDYYVGLMAKDAATHYDYLDVKEYDYGKTLRFLDRFDRWKVVVGKLPKHPPSS